MDARLRWILEASVSENMVDISISNLAGMPLLIRTGADDKAVHPWYSRRMVRLAEAAGANVTFSELQGKEHWYTILPLYSVVHLVG